MTPLFSMPSAFVPSVGVVELALRGIFVYFALLVALRLFGKREVGQFTIYDLVFILLVANALQPAMTGPDNSITGGVVLIVSLVVANWAVGQLDRLPAIHRLFSPPATVIIRNGTFVRWALDREGVTEDECQMAVREHGLDSIKAVQLGVLEPDGTISIVPKESTMQRGKRRVRFIRRN